jgi:hypothetical protein
MFIHEFYLADKKYYFVLEPSYTSMLANLRNTIENLAKTLIKFSYLSVDIQPNSKQEAISIIKILNKKTIGPKYYNK